MFFDTECYPNYFLVVFKDDQGVVTKFEKKPNNSLNIKGLRAFISGKTLIGFNSKMYDIPMLAYAMRGVNNSTLKRMSNALIDGDTYKIICDHNLWRLPSCNYGHIDLNVMVQKYVGLKVFGARLGAKKLQDLPYNHLEPLTPSQMSEVSKYCVNDVDITELLHDNLKEPLELRMILGKMYNMDFRSYTFGTIAEKVFSKLCKVNVSKISKKDVVFKFGGKLDYKFKSADLLKLQEDLKHLEFVSKEGEKVTCEALRRKLNIGGKIYTFAKGGLHSTESCRALHEVDGVRYIDVDVSSCYPQIILNDRLTPPQLGERFLVEFEKLKIERAKFKLEKDLDKSKGVKELINTIYGKFGDGDSDVFFAPESLIRTTVTGQLNLLLLIERLGSDVVSANTDGITVKVEDDNYSDFRKIIETWEKEFDCNTDEVSYKALYSHSVNSYIAIKEDGSLKIRGKFNKKDLSRNIDVPVCKKAVINYITCGTSIRESIIGGDNSPQDFIKMRKARHGAYWKGDYLGKNVRWYWSTKGESITNLKGHKISETDDAHPLMDLGVPMENLYYEKYVEEAYKLLKSIGVE